MICVNAQSRKYGNNKCADGDTLALEADGAVSGGEWMGRGSFVDSCIRAAKVKSSMFVTWALRCQVVDWGVETSDSPTMSVTRSFLVARPESEASRASLSSNSSSSRRRLRLFSLRWLSSSCLLLVSS